MADRGQLDVISVGIGVDLNTLEQDLGAVAETIRSKKFPSKDVKINVGVNTGQIDNARRVIRGALNEFRQGVNKDLVISPKFSVSKLSTRGLRREIEGTFKTLGDAGFVRVPVTAQIDPSRAAAIRDDIRSKIGTVNVEISWSWKDGPPPPGGSSSGPGGSPGSNGPSGGSGGGRPAGGGSAARQSRSTAATTPRPRGPAVTRDEAPAPAAPEANIISKPVRPRPARKATQAQGATPAPAPAPTPHVTQLPPAAAFGANPRQEREETFDFNGQRTTMSEIVAFAKSRGIESNSLGFTTPKKADAATKGLARYLNQAMLGSQKIQTALDRSANQQANYHGERPDPLIETSRDVRATGFRGSAVGLAEPFTPAPVGVRNAQGQVVSATYERVRKELEAAAAERGASPETIALKEKFEAEGLAAIRLPRARKNHPDIVTGILRKGEDRPETLADLEAMFHKTRRGQPDTKHAQAVADRFYTLLAGRRSSSAKARMRVGAGAKTDIMDVKPQRIALVAGLDSLRYGYGREAANTRDDAERSRIAKDRAKNTLFTNDYVKTLPDHHPLNYEEGMVDTRVENELANRDKAKTTAEMAARGLIGGRPPVDTRPTLPSGNRTEPINFLDQGRGFESVALNERAHLDPSFGTPRSNTAAIDKAARDQLARRLLARQTPGVSPSLKLIGGLNPIKFPFSRLPGRAMGGFVHGDSALATERSGHVEHVSLDTLRKYRDIDRETTPRIRNDHGYLDQLTDAMRSGVDLGPVTLDHDPQAPLNTKLFDGNHRLAAAERLGLKSLPTRMRRGGKPSEFGFRAKGGPIGEPEWDPEGWTPPSRKPGLFSRARDRFRGPASHGGWDEAPAAPHQSNVREQQESAYQALRQKRDAERTAHHKWSQEFDRKTADAEDLLRDYVRQHTTFEFREYNWDGGASAGAAPRPEGPTDTRSQVDKLKAMADQAASPNEADVARRMLRKRGIKGYAKGGPIGDPEFPHINWTNKMHGALQRRVAQYRLDPEHMSAERREAFVRGPFKGVNSVDPHYSFTPEGVLQGLQQFIESEGRVDPLPARTQRGIDRFLGNVPPHEPGSLPKARARAALHRTLNYTGPDAIYQPAVHHESTSPFWRDPGPKHLHDAITSAKDYQPFPIEDYEAGLGLEPLDLKKFLGPDRKRAKGGPIGEPALPIFRGGRHPRPGEGDLRDVRATTGALGRGTYHSPDHGTATQYAYPSRFGDEPGYVAKAELGRPRGILDIRYGKSEQGYRVSAEIPRALHADLVSEMSSLLTSAKHPAVRGGAHSVLRGLADDLSAPYSLSADALHSVHPDVAKAFTKIARKHGFGAVRGDPDETDEVAVFDRRLAGYKKRAKGGATGRPGPYIVGERGPEIFVPESDGWIIPNHLMSQLPKRADGGSVGKPSPIPTPTTPTDAFCPDCGAGPFLARGYYERHWHKEHGAKAAAAAAAAAAAPKKRTAKKKTTPRAAAPASAYESPSADRYDPQAAPPVAATPQVEGAALNDPKLIKLLGRYGRTHEGSKNQQHLGDQIEKRLGELTGAVKTSTTATQAQTTATKTHTQRIAAVPKTPVAPRQPTPAVAPAAAQPAIPFAQLPAAAQQQVRQQNPGAVPPPAGAPPAGGGPGGGGPGGPGPGGPGGPPNKNPKQPKHPNVTAAQKGQAKADAQASVNADFEHLETIRSKISEDRSLTPVRALSVAFGQITSQLTGRAKIQARADTAAFESNKAHVALATTSGAAAQLNTLQSEERNLNLLKAAGVKLDAAQQTKLAQLPILIKGQTEEYDRANAASTAQLKIAEEAEKRILRRGDVIKNLAAGTIGVVAGTKVFNTVLAATDAALDAVQGVMGDVIERSSGFNATTTRVTAGLADQTRSANGDVKAVLALQAAHVGLAASAADVITPLIGRRAQIEAGNKAITEQIELFHTFQNLERSSPTAGLGSTTGGLFGTPILGVASTGEQVGNLLQQLGKAQGAPGNPGLTPSGEAFTNQYGTTAGARGGLGLGNKQLAVEQTVAAQNMSDFGAGLKYVNDQIVKGGATLDTFAVSADKLDAKVQKTAAAFDSVSPEMAKAIRDNGLYIDSLAKISDPVKRIQEAAKTVGSINVAATTPDPDEVIRQLTSRIIPAQKALFRAEGNFERKQQIPAQFALENIANPLPKFGSSFSTSGADSSALASVGKYRKVAGDAQDFINKKISEGRAQLLNLVPADLQGEFKGLLGEIAKTGQEIVSTETGISRLQVAAQVHQYNNELRIAKRGLEDALALTGRRHDAEQGAVGAIERENFLLNRQLQLLQFSLQQKQINFQVAVAGFVVPGLTPEEQAARVEQAKIEASFAQKQLDIQKKIAGLSFKGQVLVNERNLEDIRHTIGLLQEGRSVTISTAAASEALARLNKKQQQLVTLAGSYVNEEIKVSQAAMQAAEQAAEATGEAFSDILTKTAKAWGIFGQQAVAFEKAVIGSVPTTTTSNGTGGKRFAASGLIGDTLGPTDITVGEAGTERVAILRNPRVVSDIGLPRSGGGAGSAPITINIVVSGPVVRKEADIDDIVRKIERALGSRASLLFGRNI